MLVRSTSRPDYNKVYKSENYRMSSRRKIPTIEVLSKVERGSLLDVGCGRGEMLHEATNLGFYPVTGVEIVDALIGGDVLYAPAWDLPFASQSFDVVTIFDVLEHLQPGEDELACKEALRVSRGKVVLSTNNNSSVHGGVELHTNKRSYEDWDRLLMEWIGAKRVAIKAVTEFWTT